MTTSGNVKGMSGDPLCPRCGDSLTAPSVWASGWRCAAHGDVAPLHPFVQPTSDQLRKLARASPLPLWLPWPLPRGWVVTGVGKAGDDVGGTRATVLACSGPSPLGGAADLIAVAEDLGVGLGAHFAGLPGPDPGAEHGRGPVDARVDAGGHPVPLWQAGDSTEHAAYAGEAGGRWLWLILFPSAADILLIADFALADLRDLGDEIDVLPIGALSPRLTDRY